MNNINNIIKLNNVIYVIKNLCLKKMVKHIINNKKNILMVWLRLEIMIILLENIVELHIKNVMLNINKYLVRFLYSFIMQKVMIIIYYFNILKNLLMLKMNYKFYQKICNNI
jgi:hypothetical protein